MKFAKTTFATLVAAGLVAAPLSAQAAEARQASNVSDSEGLAGGSAILYIALLGAAIAVAVLVSDNGTDTSGLPASP
jgi:hypothetical protein